MEIGQRVMISAVVVAEFNKEREISHQIVRLRLPDGQALDTNPRNVTIPEPAPVPELAPTPAEDVANPAPSADQAEALVADELVRDEENAQETAEEQLLPDLDEAIDETAGRSQEALAELVIESEPAPDGQALDDTGETEIQDNETETAGIEIDTEAKAARNRKR